MADRTVTIKPDGGGDYTSLNTAFATEDNTYADLVTNTMILTFECYAGAEDTTGALTGTGWTTNSSYYLNIVGAPSEKTSSNTGKWSTERYRMHRNSTSDVYCLQIEEQYTRVTDIQFKRTAANLAANYQFVCLITAAAANTLVDRCIFVAALSGSSGSNIIRAIQIMADATVRNCLLYGWSNGTEQHVGIYRENGTVTAESCTLVDCYFGFRGYGTHTVKNTGVSGGNTAFSLGTWTQTACSTTTPTFVDATNKDYHLASSDTTWKDAGDGTGMSFSVDIDGQSRPATAGDWDIGCDEYVESYSPPIFTLDHEGTKPWSSVWRPGRV